MKLDLKAQSGDKQLLRAIDLLAGPVGKAASQQ
jgi:hypothetical protein